MSEEKEDTDLALKATLIKDQAKTKFKAMSGMAKEAGTGAVKAVASKVNIYRVNCLNLQKYSFLFKICRPMNSFR